MKIDLFGEGKISLPYKNITSKNIKLSAGKICSYLKLKKTVVSIIICDNKYIHQINKTYRKKNKPTDVISFACRENPMPDIKLGQEILGDIYISIEKAEENAIGYGAALQEEMERLLVHGILHLLGYDHERSRKDKKIMHDMEEEILCKLQGLSRK